MTGRKEGIKWERKTWRRKTETSIPAQPCPVQGHSIFCVGCHEKCVVVMEMLKLSGSVHPSPPVDLAREGKEEQEGQVRGVLKKGRGKENNRRDGKEERSDKMRKKMG